MAAGMQPMPSIQRQPELMPQSRLPALAMPKLMTLVRKMPRMVSSWYAELRVPRYLAGAHSVM